MKTKTFLTLLFAAATALAPIPSNAHGDDHKHDHDEAAGSTPASFSAQNGLTFAPEVAETIDIKTALAAPRAIAATKTLAAQKLSNQNAIAFVPAPDANSPLPYAVGQRFEILPEKRPTNTAAKTAPKSTPAVAKLTQISDASRHATGQLELLFTLENAEISPPFLQLAPNPAPAPTRVAVAIPREALLETATGTFVYLVETAKTSADAHDHGKTDDHMHGEKHEHAHAKNEKHDHAHEQTEKHEPETHAPRPADGQSSETPTPPPAPCYKRIAVRAGIADATHVAITHGLRPNATIVTAPVTQLWLTELRLTKGGGHSH